MAIALTKTLRSSRVLITLGPLLPIALLAAAYVDPGIRHGGVGLPMAVALASGLLIGRWWAPLPFVALWIVWLASVKAAVSSEALGYFASVVIAWAMTNLIGVTVRKFPSGELVDLGSGMK